MKPRLSEEDFNELWSLVHKTTRGTTLRVPRQHLANLLMDHSKLWELLDLEPKLKTLGKDTANEA